MKQIKTIILSLLTFSNCVNKTEEKKMSIEEINIKNYIDNTFWKNSNIMYPKLENGSEYTYGCSKVSIYKNKNKKFAIIIEKVILHNLGKITNETYFFSNIKLNNHNMYKNVLYTTIIDYDVFDTFIDLHGNINLNSESRLMNHRKNIIPFSKKVEDYSDIWIKSGYTSQNYVTTDIFFKKIIDNEDNQQFFFLSRQELNKYLPIPLDFINETNKWFFEDISDYSHTIEIIPSDTELFAKSIIAIKEGVLFFDKTNTHWTNWIHLPQ